MLVTAASVGTFNQLCISIIDSHMGIGTNKRRSTSLLFLGKSFTQLFAIKIWIVDILDMLT